MEKVKKVEKVKSYHSVIVLQDGKWYIHFGDYNRQVAADEYEEVKESGEYKKVRLITTDDTQESIDDAIAHLNKGK